MDSSLVGMSGTASLIGKRLREIRRANGWTLSDVARRTGVSIGTLSKLENERTELNFTSVNKLASGLGLRIIDLTSLEPNTTGKRALTRGSSGSVFSTGDVDFEVLCSEISDSREAYLRATIKARAFDPDAHWHRHKGQEFIYVLKGTLVLYSELYEPEVLKAGDSMLFDASMGHFYTSRGRGLAEVLITMSLDGYENASASLKNST